MTPAGPRACTEIGAHPGISITLERAIDREPRDATVTVCDAARSCTDTAIVLQPGSTTVDQGCTGTGPDAPCSASVSPNDTLVGFVVHDALTAAPVAVTITLGSGPTEQRLGPFTVTPKEFRPNGPGCEPVVLQAAVVAPMPG